MRHEISGDRIIDAVADPSRRGDVMSETESPAPNGAEEPHRVRTRGPARARDEREQSDAVHTDPAAIDELEQAAAHRAYGLVDQTFGEGE